MNKCIYILMILLGSILLNSCTKKAGSNDDHCDKLIAALTANNTAEIKKQIEIKSRGVGKIKTGATFEDIRTMLEELAASINKDCAVTASVACTLCIYTLPGQSEIMLALPGNNDSPYIIDLYTNEGEIITFIGLHQD